MSDEGVASGERGGTVSVSGNPVDPEILPVAASAINHIGQI